MCFSLCLVVGACTLDENLAFLGGQLWGLLKTHSHEGNSERQECLHLLCVCSRAHCRHKAPSFGGRGRCSAAHSISELSTSCRAIRIERINFVCSECFGLRAVVAQWQVLDFIPRAAGPPKPTQRGRNRIPRHRGNLTRSQVVSTLVINIELS